MNDPETIPFTDIALYVINILAHSAKHTATRKRLDGIIPDFKSAHLQPAIDRHWVTTRPAPPSSTDKTTRFTLTDLGLAHLRHLVELSNLVPVIA